MLGECDVVTMRTKDLLLFMKLSVVDFVPSVFPSSYFILVTFAFVIPTCLRSCLGPESCRENSGTIYVNSCRGSRACYKNEGTIGNMTSLDELVEYLKENENLTLAVADILASIEVQGSVGAGAERKLRRRKLQIESSTCTGTEVCQFNSGVIKDLSCNDDVGGNACDSNSGTIGEGSCNGEFINFGSIIVML